LLSAFDTVLTLTLDARATSRIVTCVRAGRDHSSPAAPAAISSHFPSAIYFTTPLKNPET
jgi:hypothetical protein